MKYVSYLFLSFLIFSLLGWCLEVLYGMVMTKKFVNRGFLIGPICPVYGIGCVLLYLLLNSYSKDPIMLMLASMAICSIVEYITSYVMEKIFKTRWWDYSNMKFNINGRICLEMIVPFGLLGLLVVYFLFPCVISLLSHISIPLLYTMTAILFVVFLVDLALSFNIILKFTSTISKVPKDMTEEISKFVKYTLEKQSKLTRRLVESFPNFKINFSDIKNKIIKKNKKNV